jgi:protein SCO1/2
MHTAVFLGILLAVRTFSVDGVVVAVDPAARTMLVSHRPIAGYMGAMTMPFHVEDAAELAGLTPGTRVRFDLAVSRDRTVARRVAVTGRSELPPSKGRLAIGGALPEFRLTDQAGRTVTAADLRGKVAAVDFIYTRCPLPEVCPRLSANFALLQRRFGAELLLVSVTVDPEYDTPAVLAAYARRWGADPSGWLFLTGDVAGLAASLGQIYWADEGAIGHNSSTAVIGRDGRLAALLEGSEFRVDQLADVIARVLEEK